MKMKIIANRHFTATEKKAIKTIIERGWLEGSTSRKSYFLTKTKTGFDVRIQTTEINDFGRRGVRNSYGRVEISED